MSLILVGAEWESAFRNLMTLLKPGGYIQWIESDFSDEGFTCVTAANPSFMKQAREAHSLWMVKIGRSCREPRKLIDIFRKAGFEAVEGQLVPTDRTLRSAEDFSRLSMPVTLVGLENGLNMGKEPLEEVEKGMLREMMGSRNYFRHDIYVALGRKKGIYQETLASALAYTGQAS